jgi:cytochrome bd-type quinol oxidase subunit 1
MDFPIFHADFLGNRMIIAIIGILHVIINHGLAVGLMPLITAIEHYGHKTNNQKYDNLAHKLLFIAFIITTTVGALTGVGIWLSVGLINPYSIGSLIRVFFWAWFI